MQRYLGSSICGGEFGSCLSDEKFAHCSSPIPPIIYRSSFSKWDKRASVRVSPQHFLESGDSNEVYFPPDLAPVVEHPIVASRGLESIRRLLVHRLYSYLNFTVQLEQIVVVPVAMLMSRGSIGSAIPGKMREDAFRIATDEMWHAQFSFDMINQVQHRQTAGLGCDVGNIRDTFWIRRR